MSAQSSSPRCQPVSALSAGLPRFLARVVEHGFAVGLRRPEDFVRHFPPRRLMRSLAREPERRGRILEQTTGLRMQIASRKSPDSSAEDLQIALDEKLTTPADIVELLSPDDRVRFLDAPRLWAFVIEPGYGDGPVELGEQIPEIRQHTTYIIEAALDEGLINHRDIVSAISVSTLVDRLPRSELAAVFERVLDEGRVGIAFTDELLFELVPMDVIVANVPLATLWKWVIGAKVATPNGLCPEAEPEPVREDEALFDPSEAHPDASDLMPPKEVTVIIDGDEPTEAPTSLRPIADRTA